MSATVELRVPGRESRRMTLAAASLEVGRECSGLIVQDPSVSRRHVLLTVGPGTLTIEDLGSSNGTTVNGRAVTAVTYLMAGDVVGMGNTQIVVIEVGEAEPKSDPVPVPEPAKPVRAPEPETESQVVRPIAVRPELDELAKREDDAAVLRYRPGSSAETMVAAYAGALRRARKRLAGFGSEAWGIKPQVCLVDPLPDPAAPGGIMTSGTLVDAERSEIWMVVSPESPPEPPERPLALLFGSALPAAQELGWLLEGYGLHLAGSPNPDPQLREAGLEPLGSDSEQAGPMALSFVRFLLDRQGPKAFLRFLAEARPGQVDAAAKEVYGTALAGLEESWGMKLQQGGPKVKPLEFLRLTLRYLRPHRRREIEAFVYMIFGLGFSAALPFGLRRLFDDAIPSGEFSQVSAVLGFLAAVFAISVLANLRRFYLSAYVSSAIVRDLRVAMFNRLQSLSMRWFSQQQQGDIVSRLIYDVGSLESGMAETIRQGTYEILALVTYSVILLTLNPILGAVVLLAIPVVAVIFKAMAAGALNRSVAVQEQMGGLSVTASENYDAQRVIKAFGMESAERGRFSRASERMFAAHLRLQLYSGVFGEAVQMIFNVIRIVVLGLGAYLILQGNFTLGGLIAFFSLMLEVLIPITSLTDLGQGLQEASGALARVNEILDEVPDVKDEEGATPIGPLRSEIRLQNLGFSYTPERRTLDGINAVIPAGSRVAFVGPTGAGKSSVLHLIMRFADPDEGAILFDGKDIKSATMSSVRGQLGVVLQEAFLFDASIKENIAVGKPGASQAEIEEAARAAELHEFIEDLPRGYDTMVGERGGQLSGGQRQRVAIARALIRNPSVLILDEATSALDPKTERTIAATLTRAGRDRTTIAVTHRLNSITDYDRIFVIVAGKLVEQGTHRQLVDFGGVYAELWAEQTGGVVADTPFDVATALARIPVFSALNAEGLALVESRMTTLVLSPGERFPEGGGRLVIVKRGRAQLLAPRPGGGEEVFVTELEPGDAFGLAAILGNETGSVLVAEGPVSLLVLDDEAMSALRAALPQISSAVTGLRSPTVAPAGGRRLSRVTLSGPLTHLPANAPPLAGSAGPRLTGAFGPTRR
jgi:ABC-type multidrug transport system fused ATPase/permease subunit